MPKHYSKAKLSYGAHAYCDQYEKILAIHDRDDNLRAIVAQADDGDYYLLLIGDDRRILYAFEGIELGSVSKNSEACSKIYRRLRGVDTPVCLVPSSRCSHSRYEKIELSEFFSRADTNMPRAINFRAAEGEKEDIVASRTSEAFGIFKELVGTGVEMVDCSEEDHEYYYHHHPGFAL